jgi:hypothetical protein
MLNLANTESEGDSGKVQRPARCGSGAVSDRGKELEGREMCDWQLRTFRRIRKGSLERHLEMFDEQMRGIPTDIQQGTLCMIRVCCSIGTTVMLKGHYNICEKRVTAVEQR